MMIEHEELEIIAEEEEEIEYYEIMDIWKADENNTLNKVIQSIETEEVALVVAIEEIPEPPMNPGIMLWKMARKKILMRNKIPKPPKLEKIKDYQRLQIEMRQREQLKKVPNPPDLLKALTSLVKKREIILSIPKPPKFEKIKEYLKEKEEIRIVEKIEKIPVPPKVSKALWTLVR